MTKKHNINSKSGFTIIEVVLVLAIAGLIFLMVFVAFPALQRSQQDTRRTDDMGRVQSALMNWQNNHNNNLPNSKSNTDVSWTAVEDFNEVGSGCGSGDVACEFVRDYMNSATVNSDGSRPNTFEDPSGNLYNVVITRGVQQTTSHPDGTIVDLGNSVSYGPNGESQLVSATSSTGEAAVTIGGSAPFEQYVVYIIPGAACDEDKAVSSTKNNFAVLYHMEGSGVKCVNNGS